MLNTTPRQELPAGAKDIYEKALVKIDNLLAGNPAG
jgi:hypothetical protein